MAGETLKSVDTQQKYLNNSYCYSPIIMDEYAALDNDICSPMGMNGSIFSGYEYGCGYGFGSLKDMDKMRNSSYGDYAVYQANEQEKIYKDQVNRQVRIFFKI